MNNFMKRNFLLFLLGILGVFTSAGSINYGAAQHEGFYIVLGIANIIALVYHLYKDIKNNTDEQTAKDIEEIKKKLRKTKNEK